MPSLDPAKINAAGLAAQLPSVLLLKAAQILGMALFMILAPRLMGPNRFGQFAVILSVNALWMTTCSLGGRYVFGRYVPEYASNGQTDRVRAVFMHILLFRLVVIFIATPLLWAALRRLLPQVSNTALVLSACAFAAMTISSTMFAASFGLNRLGISMSKEALGRLLLLLFLLTLGGVQSLERATLALLFTEVTVLVVGLAMTRRLFTMARGVFDLSALLLHVRFGLAIFAANFLLRLPWRLGEGALALLDSPAAEIAFYSVALSATVAFTRVFGSLMTLLIPTLSLKQAAGDPAGRDESLGIALKYLTVVACAFVFSVLILGPWAVRLLLGVEYSGVLPNLSIVALAALFVPFIRSSISLAVVEDRVTRVFQLSVVALTVFLLATALLVPDYASRGSSITLVLAVASAAGVAVLQIRSSRVLQVARTKRHLLAASPPALLLATAGTAPLVAAVAAALYLTLLASLRVVTLDELRRLLRETRGARTGAESIIDEAV
jgi:O-antigen/teichoic acid export membrane protein